MFVKPLCTCKEVITNFIRDVFHTELARVFLSNIKRVAACLQARAGWGGGGHFYTFCNSKYIHYNYFHYNLLPAGSGFYDHFVYYSANTATMPMRRGL
jgi:hypothetical protein